MISKSKIHSLLQKYNFGPSKKKGQNFLIDPEISQQIVHAANCKNKSVIEIGPGFGSLSIFLLEDVKKLISYEIDEKIVKVLKEEIQDPKFILIHEDFLNAIFNWKDKKILVANIPYNITSLILFKIFKNISKFSTAVIMVQKEVGERIVAKSKDHNYGKLSVVSQLLAKITKVVDVPASAFFPKPKIDSVVLKFEFLASEYNFKLFNFVKNAFSMPRKTILNNLKNEFRKSEIIKFLEILELNINIRPQELKPLEFVKLFDLLTI